MQMQIRMILIFLYIIINFGQLLYNQSFRQLNIILKTNIIKLEKKMSILKPFYFISVEHIYLYLGRLTESTVIQSCCLWNHVLASLLLQLLVCVQFFGCDIQKYIWNFVSAIDMNLDKNPNINPNITSTKLATVNFLQ